jgi:hypothetical protein
MVLRGGELRVRRLKTKYPRIGWTTGFSSQASRQIVYSKQQRTGFPGSTNNSWNHANERCFNGSATWSSGTVLKELTLSN